MAYPTDEPLVYGPGQYSWGNPFCRAEHNTEAYYAELRDQQAPPTECQPDPRISLTAPAIPAAADAIVAATKSVVEAVTPSPASTNQNVQPTIPSWMKWAFVIVGGAAAIKWLKNQPKKNPGGMKVFSPHGSGYNSGRHQAMTDIMHQSLQFAERELVYLKRTDMMPLDFVRGYQSYINDYLKKGMKNPREDKIKQYGDAVKRGCRKCGRQLEPFMYQPIHGWPEERWRCPVHGVQIGESAFWPGAGKER